MEFFIKSKVCVSRHTPSGSAPNLGAALFHAYAHMRIIYILVVGVVVEAV